MAVVEEHFRQGKWQVLGFWQWHDLFVLGRAGKCSGWDAESKRKTSIC